MEKKPEKIIIKRASDLPVRVQREIGCYSGLVEISVTKNSGAVPSIMPLRGLTFGDHVLNLIKKEGLVGTRVFE